MIQQVTLADFQTTKVYRLQSSLKSYISSKGTVFKLIIASLITVICSCFFAFANPKFSIALALIPLIVFISFAFRNHKDKLLFGTLIYSFFGAFIHRYLPEFPFGTVVDLSIFILILTHLFSHKNPLESKSFLSHPIVIALTGWLALTTLELLNPYGVNNSAWIVANRSLGFYPVVFVLLATIILYQNGKRIQVFINIWGTLTILCALWGLKQSYFGLTTAEQAWLDAGAADTHLLFGELRCFSLLSDAAQFGAAQAHSALVFGLLACSSSIAAGKRKFYLTAAVFAFLGLLVSGTRGAFFILIVGFSVYTILSGRWKIILAGIIALATIYAILNYTNIGDSFYAMRRLRTAFNTGDPSLVIRLERIESLKVFMADKPFGFGIGTSGLVGQKYYPNGPEILKWTDGHYINIWMQMGIFGLISKILVYLSIIIFSCIRILKMRLSNDRNIATILLCGFCGFIVSDFTNDHTTQLPTSIILPTTLGIIALLTRNHRNNHSAYFPDK